MNTALPEADYSMTDGAFNAENGRFKGDDHLYVRFFLHPKLNQTESAEKQRPVYKDTDYVQIMQPGNKHSIVIRPATEEDKQRFPEHYARYQARVDQDVIEGTPLIEWPGITRSQCEELAYFQIRTVEQLAELSDANVGNVMGAPGLKAKAQQWLADSKEGATKEALENAHSEIEELKAQMAELLKQQAQNADAAKPSEEEKEPAAPSRRRRKAS